MVHAEYDLSILSETIIQSIEDFIKEYGYTKTIQYFKGCHDPQFAQFTYGLYLTHYHISPMVNMERGAIMIAIPSTYYGSQAACNRMIVKLDLQDTYKPVKVPYNSSWKWIIESIS